MFMPARMTDGLSKSGYLDGDTQEYTMYKAALAVVSLADEICTDSCHEDDSSMAALPVNSCEQRQNMFSNKWGKSMNFYFGNEARMPELDSRQRLYLVLVRLLTTDTRKQNHMSMLVTRLRQASTSLLP